MDFPSYRPSAFYLRRAFRTAETIEESVELGLALVSEYEQLREWIREQGFIPPKFTVLRDEAEEKGWELGA